MQNSVATKNVATDLAVCPIWDIFLQDKVH